MARVAPRDVAPAMSQVAEALSQVDDDRSHSAAVYVGGEATERVSTFVLRQCGAAF
jgi:hypothetical protein